MVGATRGNDGSEGLLMEQTMQSLLAPLPYDAWAETKKTLQLYTQVVGKVQLRYTRLRNHWWNITFRPTSRGIATHMMQDGSTFFDIEFDFIDHRLVVRSNRTRQSLGFPLHDGLSVAEFYASLFAIFGTMGLKLSILPVPYGQEGATPFAEDAANHRYDPTLVRRWWDALLWTTDVMNEFGTSYVGKQSEPQLFWHSFDLAVSRYSGRKTPGPAPASPVMREAYFGEVIAFGFWAGDPNIPAPTYYTYTAPEPASLTSFTLSPASAHWVTSGSGHLGTLPYDVVRESSDPPKTLLEFFESGFEAGTSLAFWDTAALTRDAVHT